MTRGWSLHVPEAPRDGVLVVMLHGCVQPASEFAVATRMNDAAGARGWAVLWPEQSPAAHELRCWNWYLPEHQRRGEGEPAMIAAIVRDACAMHGFRRVFLAGISAGAAMAAILAVVYPDLFAAAAFHSGVPFGAASGALAGLAVMRDADSDPLALGQLAHRAMSRYARAVPTLVLHGGQDQALNPRNGTHLAQQFAVANRLALGEAGEIPATSETVRRDHARHEATIVTYGGAMVEEWRVPALGHAWSGGSPAATYTDPAGPDATAAILEFFAGATS